MPNKKPEKSLDELLEEALVKEDEQPYEVPGNWEWVKFGAVCQLRNGFGFNSKDYCEEGISLIRISDIKSGVVTTEGAIKIPAKLYDERYEVKKGDLLLAMSGATTGKSGIFKADQTVMQNQRVGNLKIINKYAILADYRNFFILKSADNILRLAYGGAQPNISAKRIENLQFPLPPLPEQKRIVKKLTSMLGKLKEARELIQEARDTFKERRAAILNKAFTGELTKKRRKEHFDVENVDNIFASILNNKKKNNKGKKKADIISQEKMEIAENEIPYDVPAGWKWTRFGDVCKAIKDGTHFSPKKQYNEDGENRYLYITSKNIRAHGLVFDNITYIDEDIHKEIYKRCDPKLGDILLVKDGAKTGTVVINTIDKEFSLLSSVAVLKVFENTIEPNYIKNFLKSPMGRNIIFSQISGSAITRITLVKINEFALPIPPLEEQKEIVRILEKLLDHEDEVRALIDMEEQIDLLEKSILSKAFRGELGTNDHNDEPAIELLKRSLKEKMNK